jgi:putative oxidoreductase
MMIIVIVAIVAARFADVDSLETLLGFDEVTYFVMFAWLGIAGPGPISLDCLVLHTVRPNRSASEYGAQRQTANCHSDVCCRLSAIST